MRRKAVSVYLGISLLVLVGLPLAASAVLDDAAICPGTGQECLVHTRITVTDPDGIDITHPAGNGGPLTLHILPGGAIVANTNPLTPLVIKAGAIVVDSGGGIIGDVFAGQGNTITLTTIDTAPPAGEAAVVDIHGLMEASALRLNGSGGDGGSISVTSAGPCQIAGRIATNGSAGTSIGGSGGNISFDCATVTVNRGALIDASASGPGGAGGSISLTSENDGLMLAKGATLRALGSGIDGGSVSLASNSNDPAATCTIASKVLLDAKTVATVLGPSEGTGGSIDISCGGNIRIQVSPALAPSFIAWVSGASSLAVTF